MVIYPVDSVIHFLNNRGLNNCPREHNKQYHVGTRGNENQSLEKLCKTGKILSSVSFQQYFYVLYEFQMFFLTFDDFFCEDI